MADGIVPDGKDWTWVLLRPCPECRLDTRTVDPHDVAGMLRANAASWRDVLTVRSTEELRRRPDPSTWSALEYACHVRDVCRIFHQRLDLIQLFAESSRRVVLTLGDECPSLVRDLPLLLLEQRARVGAGAGEGELEVAGERLLLALDDGEEVGFRLGEPGVRRLDTPKRAAQEDGGSGRKRAGRQPSGGHGE